MGSSCTSTTKSESSLPEWLTGPASDAIGRSVTESQKPFTPYTGELTAGLTPAQQQAIAVMQGSQGNWAGQFQAAQTDLNNYRMAPTATGAGAGLINAGAGVSSLEAASPLIAAGTGPGGTAAASPFLSAASQTAPGAISSYMSPYTSGVVDEIARLGSRNLTENIIPNINDTFIGSGQFGSDRNAATIGNSIRDASRDIAGQQSAALERGYGTAGSLFQSDQSRLAGLAGTAGNLAEAEAGRSLTGASLVGNLAGADANRSIQAGSLLAGLADADRNAILSGSRQGASLSGQQQQQNLSDVNGLLAAGGVQQQTEQAGNQSALQEWLRQQNFGKDQLSFLNSIIRGTPAPQTSTQSAQSSPISTAAGIASLFAGMFKEGGRVRSGGALASFRPTTRLREGGAPLEEETEEERLYRLSREGKPELEAEAISVVEPEPVAEPVGALASVAPPPVPAITAPAAGKGALAAYRESLFKDATDDSDIKKAMEEVDALQKSALERPKREKGWLDSPFTQAGLAILAAPPGTSGLQAIGQGALTAVKNRQAEKRLDAQEEKEHRINVLKATQQRLSDLMSNRKDKRAAITTLLQNDVSMANATEATQARIQAVKDKLEGDLQRAREANQSREFMAGLAAESRRAIAAIVQAGQNSRLREREDGLDRRAGLSADVKRDIQAARSGDAAAALRVKEKGIDLAAEGRTLDREERGRIADGKLIPKEVRLADALGFDLETPEGREQFADFSMKAKPAKGYAPLQIERAQKIIDDPKAAPELKAAAKGILEDRAGTKPLTAAQRAMYRGKAATLAQADLTALLKDFQYDTAEELEAAKARLTDKYTEWLAGGSQGNPPVAEPPAKGAAPAPAVVPAAGAPAPAVVPPPAPAKPAPAAPGPRMSEAEKKARFEVRTVAEPAIKELDDLIGIVDKAGTRGDWKTGLGGAMQRGWSNTGGQLVGNPSEEDTEYFSRIRALKPALHRFLKVDSNMSKAERKDLEALLDNEAWFQSQPTVLQNFKTIKRVLSTRRAAVMGEEQPKEKTFRRPAGDQYKDWVAGPRHPGTGKPTFVSPDGKRAVLAIEE